MREGEEEGESFFFQAEDGIRDRLVTGVQTCALPIYEIVEFQDDVIESHQLQIAEQYGFQLTDHSLYLYGLCRRCK